MAYLETLLTVGFRALHCSSLEVGTSLCLKIDLKNAHNEAMRAVIQAGGVVGAQYRATRVPCGLRVFFVVVVGRARAICYIGLSAYTRVVRSVDREDRPPQWGVVHEHTRRLTPVFMNTQQQKIEFSLADRGI